MATPDWKGLFNWSTRYQDGTTAGTGAQMKPEDRAWVEEAMQQYTMDVAQRMTGIKKVLDDTEETGEALENKEKLLDELVEIVENIDYAKDLTTIGGIDTLLSLLKSQHPSLRARSAEVAATCVQNNPPVQSWFLQGGALPKLLELLDDPDASCRQKGLLAISCLIRNNVTGLRAFLAVRGADRLTDLLVKGDSPRVERKALQLLSHIAQEVPHVLPVPRLLAGIGKALQNQNQDRDLSRAALNLLVQLSKSSDLRSQLHLDPALEEALHNLRAQLLEDKEDEDLHEVENVLKELKQWGRSQNQARAQAQTRESAAEPLQAEVMLIGPP